MSNALAIAGVTAVLKDLLDTGMIDHRVTDALGQGVTVSAVAPDSIDLTSNGVPPRLNLFMHQALPNAAWRNVGMPSRDATGARVSNPPLALDLHYLVTAYASEDFQAEILLGYAMHLLHETPVLARAAIRTALDPPRVDGAILPTIYQALRAVDLADQVEQIKITLSSMSTEEMSRLWSALQAHYRPTATYQVSVVLIEAARPTRAALPVLTRGPVEPATQRERGVAVGADLLVPLPTIDSVTSPSGQPIAAPGAVVTVAGHHLDGSNRAIRLTNVRLGTEVNLPALAVGGYAHLRFQVPVDPTALSAGAYTLAVSVVRPGEAAARLTNELPLVIAPDITTAFPMAVALDAAGTATVTINCRPAVRPGQRASLLLGDREVFADISNTPRTTLVFAFIGILSGTYPARLRVDGIESRLIDHSVSPPVFLNRWVEIS